MFFSSEAARSCLHRSVQPSSLLQIASKLWCSGFNSTSQNVMHL